MAPHEPPSLRNPFLPPFDLSFIIGRRISFSRLRRRVSPYRELKGRFRKNGKSLRACQSAVAGFATIRLMMIHCSISSGSCAWQPPSGSSLPGPDSNRDENSKRDCCLRIPWVRNSGIFLGRPRTPFFDRYRSLVDPSRTKARCLAPFLFSAECRQIYPPNSWNLHMSLLCRSCVNKWLIGESTCKP